MKIATTCCKQPISTPVRRTHSLRRAVREVTAPNRARRWAGSALTAGLLVLANPAFGQILELSDLDGSGFKFNGGSPSDYLGTSVSGAGDVNGDGFDDVIIGAIRADTGGFNNSGASYVVFGTDQGFTTPMEPMSLNGANGFQINGESHIDHVGGSVSTAGDINGDGIDDLVVGAAGANPNDSNSGASYVVFGSTQSFSTPLELVSLDGSNGFKINGEMGHDLSGSSVSAAGDVNGDTFDDVIIGAPQAEPNGSRSGASYVVFGSDQGFSTPLELASLDGTNGFKMNGEANNLSGYSVSAAGDVNGDGIDDMIIGAHQAGIGATGATYLVFGTDQGFVTPIELASLDGGNGFKIIGEALGDRAGYSVSGAGDVNGDGFDDVIIGTHASASQATVYVVFGTDQGFGTPFELAALDGSNGFKVVGGLGGFIAGNVVSAAGDVNGDGIHDVIIGGRLARAGYVVFGDNQGFSTPFDLSGLARKSHRRYRNRPLFVA